MIKICCMHVYEIVKDNNKIIVLNRHKMVERKAEEPQAAHGLEPESRVTKGGRGRLAVMERREQTKDWG